MNKFWLIIALLTDQIAVYGSDLTPQLQRITPINFRSSAGHVRTIDIADTDSVGIVYRKVVKAFGWNSYLAICCCCDKTYIPLTLDITNNFSELLKLLPYQGRDIVVKPYPNTVQTITIY